MKRKTWITIGTLLVVGSGAYLGVNYFLAKRKSKDLQKQAADDLSKGNSTPAVKAEFPLKKGSKGMLVSMLQEWLNKNNNETLTVDGIFGSKTEAAVKRNQMPFESFKTMYPTAVEGQVSENFFTKFIK